MALQYLDVPSPGMQVEKAAAAERAALEQQIGDADALHQRQLQARQRV